MVRVQYRHPAEADVEFINDVVNRSSRELPLHRDETVSETREFTFEEDDYDPEGFLLAVIDEDVVGYGGSHVNDHRLRAGKNDAWIYVEVVPEQRGRGIEQELMRFGMDYLMSRDIAIAHRWCVGTEGWRHDLSKEFGFRDTRHFFRLEWKEEDAPEPAPMPAGIDLDQGLFKEMDDETIIGFAEVLNESFADHYNFAPRPPEQFVKWRDTDENITRMSWVKDKDRIVGVCMSAESVLYNLENDAKVGWVNVLGVVKSHRRKGIGRAMLSEGMRWIFDRGMDTIYLGMDAENRKALGLYTSLGFKVKTESIGYTLGLS